MSKTYLNIKVQSRSRHAGVEKISTNEYKVRVHAPPSKGEANKEVIQTIAGHFDIPASFVTIVRGHKSRNKLVSLESTNVKN